jgi:single-stranded DNA-binding protein
VNAALLGVRSVAPDQRSCSKADCVQRFSKGQRVLVIDCLEIGEWETREGEKRTSYDIWADDVVNLSRREDGSRGQDEPTGVASSPGQDEDLGELSF